MCASRAAVQGQNASTASSFRRLRPDRSGVRDRPAAARGQAHSSSAKARASSAHRADREYALGKRSVAFHGPASGSRTLDVLAQTLARTVADGVGALQQRVHLVIRNAWPAAAVQPRRPGRRPARRALAGRGRPGGSGRWSRPVAQRGLPDPLARVWSALSAPTPATSCSRWRPGSRPSTGAASPTRGGGSHGSLHAGDSLGPLLFVGCGPTAASEREQWTLSDVAPAVLDHFGL